MPPGEVGAVWSRVAPMLAKAMEHGAHGYTLAHVREAIETQRAMLWLYVRDNREVVCAAVTQLGANGTALEVWLMAGEDFGGWCHDLQDRLREYAREHGLTHVQAHVRPGLTRWLRELGWDRVCTTMRISAHG